MFDFISATPAQKLAIHQLQERHEKAPCWVQYDPREDSSNLKVMFFAPKYLFEYTLNGDGYIKQQFAYDNPKHVRPE